MLHYYQTYLPVLNEMILSVRKSQHNHNNMIQSLYSLSQMDSEKEQLQTTLEKYKNHTANSMIPSKLMALENKLLVALLYGKYESAKEKGINVVFQLHSLTYKSRTSEFELVDLTGILLDNAIEASQEGDTIFIEIGRKENDAINKPETPEKNIDQKFHITIKNPGPIASQEFIQQIFSVHYTTKEKQSSNHGLGLSYLKSVVNRYHGHIEVENEYMDSKNNTNICYLVIRIIF